MLGRCAFPACGVLRSLLSGLGPLGPALTGNLEALCLLRTGREMLSVTGRKHSVASPPLEMLASDSDLRVSKTQTRRDR